MLLHFFRYTYTVDFDYIWNHFPNIIFENGQGLGLDANNNEIWHTTSNAGITNPYSMLKDKKNFNAEICYVTRSYLTRHGNGYLENEASEELKRIYAEDKTNVFNDFQGNLRYGEREDIKQKQCVYKDEIIENDSRFSYTYAVTHCNEFNPKNIEAKYRSFNPYSVKVAD